MMIPSLQVATVIALGVAAQWLAWWMGVPAIVLLLAFGLALGNFTTLAATPTEGDFFFATVSLAVGLILFEGGLSLNVRDIVGTRGVVVRLVTVGLLITWVLGVILAYWIADFSGQMAFLLGALLTVSGPTVVLPLLRHVQPVRRVGSLAKWEGIVNDPIGAVLAALVFEVILQPARSGGVLTTALQALAVTVGVGLALGGLGAWLVVQVLKRYLAPDHLHSPLVLVLVTLLFAASNAIQHEAGLLTVTVMGVALANQRTASIRHIVEFKENLRVLLISTLFIVLAARIEINAAVVKSLGWQTMAYALLMILLVRPLSVLAATANSPLSRQERIFLAWIHPRGIVAAAVSSLFALRIVRELGENHPLSLEADRFVLATFLVIVTTVTVYGLTLGPLARRLGLSTSNPQGILFAGASAPVREIAAAIREEGYAVLLVDTNPRNVAAARMANLPVLYASIGSEFVQEEIDMGGIGRLLAMTPNDEVNTLACMGMTERFGRSEVYQLAAADPASEKRELVKAYRRGRTLFSRTARFDHLETQFEQGARVKKTSLSEGFTYEDFIAKNGAATTVLFRIDDLGKLTVATDGQPLTAKAGHKLISIATGEKSAPT